MAKAKIKPYPFCSLNHLDCVNCIDGKCRCLTDMEVVNKYKHCGFYKTREEK